MSRPKLRFVNLSPVHTWVIPWRTKQQGDTLSVVCKATCDLVPGEPAQLRSETQPPSGDLHAADDTRLQLEYPSDFAIHKPLTDVMLVGHAYAPGGSASSMIARLAFGGSRGFERSVAVIGERHWEPSGAPSEPRFFARMPLSYDRAFGGPGSSENPVGRGLERSDASFGRPPNLEDPRKLLRSPRERPTPACFAPIAPMWPTRWSKLGSYDARWLAESYPYFPDDFDPSFFQAAPASQQLPHVRGDERFVIEGMHPSHTRLEGQLPEVGPRIFAQRESGAWLELSMQLDTILFRPDELELTLLWRAVVPSSSLSGQAFTTLYTTLEPHGTELSTDEAAARCAREGESGAKRERAAPSAGASAPEAVAARAEIQRKLSEAGVPHAWFAPDLSPRIPLPSLDAIRAQLGASTKRDPALVGALSSLQQHAESAREARRRVEQRLERGESLAGAKLAGADLSGLDLSGRDLRKAQLSGANLLGAKLVGADLRNTRLAGACLAEADLSEAELESADLSAANLEGAKLDRARLGRADFTGANGRRSSWQGASGARAGFSDGDWSEARFTGAELGEASFLAARIDHAVFDDAKLPEVRLYDAVGEGVSFVGADLRGARANEARLPRADLRGVSAPASVWDEAELRESRWAGADLSGACLNDAMLEGALMRNCKLRSAQLRGASLGGASLHGSDLMEATLEAADLRDADLRAANLTGAELWKAEVSSAKLDGAQLYRTKLEVAR